MNDSEIASTISDLRSRIQMLESEALSGRPFTNFFDMPVNSFIPEANGSNAITSFEQNGSTGDKVHIRGGNIRWSRRGSKTFIDSDFDSPGGIRVLGGTKTNPGYVWIRIDATLGVSSATPGWSSSLPEDDGTYIYYILHEAYLYAEGLATFGRDLRLDWILRSPL